MEERARPLPQAHEKNLGDYLIQLAEDVALRRISPVKALQILEDISAELEELDAFYGTPSEEAVEPVRWRMEQALGLFINGIDEMRASLEAKETGLRESTSEAFRKASGILEVLDMVIKEVLPEEEQ
ncbi:MAG: hypothetical protein RDV48_06230 [Candidatus Eremiobacteraeota bacterium]|nr:hypothetical protein [Candidatus Eremiobacteraeota bacterium]